MLQKLFFISLLVNILLIMKQSCSELNKITRNPVPMSQGQRSRLQRSKCVLLYWSTFCYDNLLNPVSGSQGQGHIGQILYLFTGEHFVMSLWNKVSHTSNWTKKHVFQGQKVKGQGHNVKFCISLQVILFMLRYYETKCLRVEQRNTWHFSMSKGQRLMSWRSNFAFLYLWTFIMTLWNEVS